MEPKAFDQGHYRHYSPVQIRFGDVDRFGHVNNNAYFAYYDIGKQAYMLEVFGREVFTSDIAPVIVNINADFIMPVLYADEVGVETRISHLGEKSFVIQQRVVRRDGTVCSQCATTMVCFSLKEQKSVEIPENYRFQIEAYERYLQRIEHVA